MKILLIEDEAELQELIGRALETERYIVERADSYRTALEKVEVYDYDCILLDIMLPDGDGLRLLERIKQMRKRDSVIIISARDAVEDKIRGLDLGADDYLAKPFHLSELIARVKSVIRRKHRDGEELITVGNVAISPDDFRVFVEGVPLELSRKEYDILLFFAMRAGRLINKSMLAEGVWGDYIDQADSFDFIYAQVKNLRKKLSTAGATIQLKSVYGIGYKLVEGEP